MTALRMGLVGFGAMGRNHARVLSVLDDVDLVAVADPNVGLTALPDGTPIVPDVEALLAHQLDACVVAAPTSEHRRLGLALAEAGVHALIEKPLTEDLRSAMELRDAFGSRGLVGAVGHIERYNPAVHSLWDHLTAGTLGEVYQVTTQRIGPFPARIRDVGVVLDLATHDVDLTAWLCGSRYTSVGARTAHYSVSEHEDLVTISGLLASGTITSHVVNWLSPFKQRLVTVTGEKGAFIADTLTADLTYYAREQLPIHWDSLAQLRGASECEVVRLALQKTEPLLLELRAFRDAVLGINAAHVTMDEAVRTVAVAEAALTSASTGKLVELDEQALTGAAGQTYTEPGRSALAREHVV